MAVLTPVFPAEEPRCERFAVTLAGAPADVLAVRVSAMPYNCEWPGHQRPLDQTEIAGMVILRADGPVEVCVRVAQPFKEVCLRPLKSGVALHTEGDTVRFTLPGPGQYTLEPDGPARALHLFVSPMCQPPCAADTLYYGPGVHEIGTVELHSGQTVVLDDGAVVYGGFVAIDAEDITVCGGGILDGSREVRTDDTALVLTSVYDPCQGGDPQAAFACDMTAIPADELRAQLQQRQVLNGCLRFYRCRNVTVRGITCRDSSTFTIVPAACDNVLIEDVKLVGMWRYNSDGIDLFNTSNCIIRGCFLRDFDDCVVIKGMAGWESRPNENVLVERCVIWCDWGRALELGAETNATAFRNILLRDCDVIHGTWLQLDIQHHNYAPIHDIVFEDIRCEYTRHQLPLKFQPAADVPYEQADTLFEQPALLGAFFYDMGRFGPGHADEQITRIRFIDIQVLSDEEVPMPACQFTGLSEANCVRDVVIENLTRNGQPLTTPQQAHLECGPFVYDVTLR